MSLDITETPLVWKATKQMPLRLMDFTLTALGGRFYAVGGRYGTNKYSNNNIYRARTNSWKSMANYPYYIWRHCAVADAENDRFFVIGGDYSNSMGVYQGVRSDIRYYQVSILDLCFSETNTMFLARFPLTPGTTLLTSCTTCPCMLAGL